MPYTRQLTAQELLAMLAARLDVAPPAPFMRNHVCQAFAQLVPEKLPRLRMLTLSQLLATVLEQPGPWLLESRRVNKSRHATTALNLLCREVVLHASHPQGARVLVRRLAELLPEKAFFVPSGKALDEAAVDRILRRLEMRKGPDPPPGSANTKAARL